MYRFVNKILSVILSKLFLISIFVISGCFSGEHFIEFNKKIQGILSHVSGSETVVLMIGGSGPVDVDYTVDGIGIYAKMAGYFAEHQISSLRIEKRDDADTIQQEYLDDVHAALAYLNERYHQVFLLGHSLGAHVAPVFSDDVDGLILMGGFVSEVEEVYAAQLKQNASYEEIQVIEDELDTILNLCEDTGFSWFGIRESWYLSMDELHLKSCLKGLNCPVLVVFSGCDERVDLSEFELYQAYLSSHENAEFRLIEDVNHFFVDVSSGQLNESVVNLIASWILKQSSVIIKARCCE